MKNLSSTSLIVTLLLSSFIWPGRLMAADTSSNVAPVANQTMSKKAEKNKVNEGEATAKSPLSASTKKASSEPAVQADRKNATKSATKEAAGGVSINKATAEELAAALNGIGLKKAQVIVHYREEYGPFSNIEQLKEVPGIGPVLFERNRDKLKM